MSCADTSLRYLGQRSESRVAKEDNDPRHLLVKLLEGVADLTLRRYNCK